MSWLHQKKYSNVMNLTDDIVQYQFIWSYKAPSLPFDVVY